MGHYVRLSAEKTDDIQVLCGVDKFYTGNEFSFPVYKSTAEIAEKPDCIVDFSVPQGIYDYLPYAVQNGIPCVIATTGYSEEDYAFIRQCSEKIAILQSGNLSVGINLLLRLVKETAALLGNSADIEIVETHHNKKKDAPSGTALLLANGIREVLPDHENHLGRAGVGKRERKEIGISAVRGGTVVGKHAVSFFMDGESITLSHEAENKSILSDGSLTAARFIVKQRAGLYSASSMFS